MSQTSDETQSGCAVRDLLCLISDQLDDMERARIAAENRFRSLVSPEVFGERGGWHGKGLPESHPVAKLMGMLAEELSKLEHKAELQIKRTMRQHALGDFARRTVGIGEKQLARLLGVIGDPVYRLNKDGSVSRRSISQLWSYCGHGDPERSRPVKGEKLGYNPKAKSRVYLLAVSCMKQAGGETEGGKPLPRSPYRDVYDRERERYAEAVHEVPCKRCGPSGKPAAVGSPLSEAHKHARALRRVGKEILRDLWVEMHKVLGESGHKGVEALDNSAASPDVVQVQESARTPATPTVSPLAPVPIEDDRGSQDTRGTQRPAASSVSTVSGVSSGQERSEVPSRHATDTPDLEREAA